MLRARTAVLAIAALLASCSSPPPPKVEPKPEPVPSAPALPPLPNGISFAAVGDIMMGTDYPENTLPDDDGVGFLAAVAPLLSAADITFGNLEGVLMDGGEAIKVCKRAKRKNEPAKAAAGAAATAPGVMAPTAAASPAMAPLGTAPTATTTAPVVAASPGTASAAAPSVAASPAASSPATTPAVAASPAASSPAAAPAVTATPAAPGATVAPASEPSPAAAPSPPEGATPPAIPTSTDDSSAQSAIDSELPTVPLEEVAPTVAPLPVPIQPAPVTETPLSSGSCYVFRSPTRYATYLRDAGFDVLSLANNHAQDFGDPGRDSSMRTLDAVGIHHSGRDGDIAEWTTQGRRFALVAFAPNVGSHQLNDLARAQQIVTDLAAHHDIVIVSFHGGSEGEGASKIPFTHELYAGEDRGNVVEFAHTVIDAGADLVIGHGPHVLRAVELYRDRLIAYSLGNFATYYGISVNGIRGIAGILNTRLAADGSFLEARLDSTIQLRPAGPSPDPERRAVAQLRDLTRETFPMGTLRIEDDGRILRTPP